MQDKQKEQNYNINTTLGRRNTVHYFYECVDEFSKSFKVYEDVAKDKEKMDKLRVKLIREELEETKEAIDDGSLVDTLDGICDMIYISAGTVLINSSVKEIITPTWNESYFNPSYEFYDLNPINLIESYINIIEGGRTNDEETSTFNSYIAILAMEFAFNMKIEDYLLDGFTEVHRSNMSKLENGKPIFREDGKITKGKNYFKPDLSKFFTND